MLSASKMAGINSKTVKEKTTVPNVSKNAFTSASVSANFTFVKACWAFAFSEPFTINQRKTVASKYAISNKIPAFNNAGINPKIVSITFDKGVDNTFKLILLKNMENTTINNK